MSHEVSKMFSVRIAPWHLGIEGGTTEKETTVLREYPGREKAMREAGHDFHVVEEPQYRKVMVDNPATGRTEARFVPVDGWKFLVSDQSTEHNKVLHSAKNSYVPIQPEVLWDLTEAILDQDEVLWETAGVLRDGAVLWTLARVDKPFFVTGDDSPIFPYVAASTTNDGLGAAKVSNINTRIVCYNTWNVAEGEAEQTGREFVFRHTKNVQQRIEDAKKVLAGATRQAQVFRDLAEELVKIPFTDKAIEQFTTEFIPMPSQYAVSDRVIGNIEEARAKVRHLFFESPTVNEEIRNTAYGALQVGTEYLDHLRKYKNTGTYMKRTLLRSEPAKAKMLPLIRAIAEENQPVAV